MHVRVGDRRRVHGNNIQVYSCALGWYLTGEHEESLGWLKPSDQWERMHEKTATTLRHLQSRLGSFNVRDYLDHEVPADAPVVNIKRSSSIYVLWVPKSGRLRTITRRDLSAMSPPWHAVGEPAPRPCA